MIDSQNEEDYSYNGSSEKEGRMPASSTGSGEAAAAASATIQIYSSRLHCLLLFFITSRSCQSSRLSSSCVAATCHGFIETFLPLCVTTDGKSCTSTLCDATIDRSSGWVGDSAQAKEKRRRSGSTHQTRTSTYRSNSPTNVTTTVSQVSLRVGGIARKFSYVVVRCLSVNTRFSVQHGSI